MPKKQRCANALACNHYQRKTKMKSSGLFRIGRDCEVRFLPNGDAVTNVSLAFNHGKQDQDGKRPTQWIEGVLFGKRAETLAPMLTKGSQHVFHMSDLHIQTYQKNDGTEGVKLAGRIDDVELTDRRDSPAPQRQQATQQRPQAPAQRPAPRQAPRPASGFDDMDDDVPF